ncbi:MAG: molybdenum ABC transporter permease [Clostridiales bacterium]|nr:molybdenum ABC transporter permease [Clostridiales bacterium]MDR2752090.1 molybdenum ABC transporter permease [Clostridiales bacterium]
MDMFPLWNSLRISLISTSLAFFLGIFLAGFVMGLPRAAKGISDALLTMPMALPPTVVGYFILVTVSPKSAIGGYLRDTFGMVITMRWQASIIAVTIVAFPLMYRTARGAFESLDKNLVDAGKTLGLSNAYIFFRIVIPNSRQGMLAGAVLAFARGLGEYGATSMVSGYIAGRTATVSTSVAYYWQINQDDMAFRWVMVNLALSLAVMILMNMFERKR